MTPTGFFEGLNGVLFKLWHSDMIYFSNGINLAKNANLYHWFAGKSKLNAVSTSQSKSKQTNLVSMVPHANWHNPTSWTHKVQYLPMVASLVNGEWRWQPQQNVLYSVFIPCMSASAIECRSIGSCNCSGLCEGLLITGFHYQLLPTLPPCDTKCQ